MQALSPLRQQGQLMPATGESPVRPLRQQGQPLLALRAVGGAAAKPQATPSADLS